MSHSNISIFVPHLGCENQCTFCNQRHITGVSISPSADDVDKCVQIALASKNFDSSKGEIAFFGGSFTAIERSYMEELLSAAYKYVKDGSVSGIRISTRPDCISVEILEFLKKYGVSAIELGAQSMSDFVLKQNKRGHNAGDVEFASKLIKDFGFELGLQMMTGLYQSSADDDLYTANKIVELKPDTVRIYPTITLKNTELEILFNKGLYCPPSLNESVELCSVLLELFSKNDIKVIRLGLHSIDETAYVAGPWHPSFRELCDSYIFKKKLEKTITKEGSYKVFVSGRNVSKAIGQNRSNTEYFRQNGILIKVITDNTIDNNDFKVEEVK